ncbi:MAG: hypothetical protein UE699_01875 [Bacilli bacterium]|mgnify:CR=1 FL=1|nr:hypothetical protein [Mycoplasmatota bacterium]MDD6941986.1 hypothetical protein [bacterium]MDY2697779.1 hypothetical protein [Bacilli bacterium]MEE0014421.1 hypothetical protein [Bacilli bacterium]
MVNRVFVYSDEEARKNNNYTTLKRLLLVIFGIFFTSFLFILFLFIFILPDFDIEFILILWVSAMLIYGFNWRKKYFPRFSAFATDTDGNVYYIKNIMPSGIFAIGGIASPYLLENVSNNTDVSFISELDKTVEIMKKPDAIAIAVEHPDSTYNIEIYRILKVHNYIETSHKIKLICDYQIKINGKEKAKNNATLTIYKSYNNFGDLLYTLLNINNNYNTINKM